MRKLEKLVYFACFVGQKKSDELSIFASAVRQY